ncbi:MAG: UDP-glucose--hexose-1-phosphate uridylyltransferase [Elusimicrobiota bacterium]|jgi:UDPglucose--hexose-1-phosphate uridylyltransferase|nr:UDP-glucose--hexose-1-phosphate uridylyltransferase [Elusimicrobiota bacterium]
MIYTNIEEILAYALSNKLIEKADITWARNTLLAILNLQDNHHARAYSGPAQKSPREILADISFYAAQNNLLPADTATYRDIFETAIMAIFTDRPSVIVKEFNRLKSNYNPKKATDWFYKYCQKIYYVKADRNALNLNWQVATNFGKFYMTINLAKPEKDPKEIALQSKMPTPAYAYPKCLLCKENEGYFGRLNHPPRQNLRLIPFKLNGGNWFFQYSPYAYYTEHSIVFSSEHTPMKINKDIFKNLLDFVEILPHYFIGANADLPLVGGSILTHDHYQAGRFTFALEQAKSIKNFKIKKHPKVSLDILNWPMTALRLTGAKKEVAAAAARIFEVWHKYDDASVGIKHATGKTQHNTLNPIARFKNGKYQMDLILRSNITSKEYPWGVFNTRPSFHNIKRENIGIIESMGMAILPGRLKNEMTQIAALIARGETEKMKDLSSLAQHYDWVKSFIDNYKNYKESEVLDILFLEIGQAFTKTLLDCGVFKHNNQGKEALLNFLYKL